VLSQKIRISSKLRRTYSKIEKKSRTSYSLELFSQPSNISTINIQKITRITRKSRPYHFTTC